MLSPIKRSLQLNALSN